MTPPAAATAHRVPTARRAAPAPARPLRPVPGPRRRSAPARPAPATRRPAAARPAPSLLGRIVDSPLLDRLIAGRLWIPCIAVALLGLVFLQVSLLQLNAGIGRSVLAAAELERANAALTAEVSRLDGGERIQLVAGREGLVMPGPGARRYLDAGPVTKDATRAAAGLSAPAPVVQQPLPPDVAVASATLEVAPTPTPTPTPAATPAPETAAAPAPVTPEPVVAPDPSAAVAGATAAPVAPTGG